MTPSTAHIAELVIYPVKSCAGIALNAAELLTTGLRDDRHWMLVDAAGRFVTQRTQPRLVWVQPALSAALLTLTAPDMPVLTVPRDEGASQRPAGWVTVWKSTLTALDEGEAAARWFTDYLGQPVRLVRFDRRTPRACSTEWVGDTGAHTEFADGFPLLVTTSASLDLLNARLGDGGATPVTMARFRPNLVLGGLPAHAEDHLALLQGEGLEAGALDAPHAASRSASDGQSVVIAPCKPCTRCPMPDVDPHTAEIGTSVRAALRAYRRDARMNGAITFGQNAIVRQGAGVILRVGDVLSVQWRSAQTQTE